ncbi:MAG TPA: PadR family transcriptional regulator [Woeseiaceae bacterium]|nr:PadR family transcriptional regulator [Woeseiaceae bacterium]
MDVKTVCLGMLTEGDATGYDLKKYFESTFSHFFAAGYGSIYPALAALFGEGLVECTEISQRGKPNRKVYRITDAGTEHLREALSDPKPSHKLRSEFLATLCFAHMMSDEQVDAVLDNRLEEIARYEAMFDEYEKAGLCQWPPGKRFVCGFGQAIVNAAKTYIQENRDLVVPVDHDQKTAHG